MKSKFLYLVLQLYTSSTIVRALAFSCQLLVPSPHLFRVLLHLHEIACQVARHYSVVHVRCPRGRLLVAPDSGKREALVRPARS